MVSASATGAEISHGARQHLMGALCICGGALAYNLIDVVIKALSGTFPLSQFLVIRALATLPIMAGLVLWEAGWGGLRIDRPVLVIVRGVVFFIGSLAFGLSIATITIADAVSIYFIMPLAIAGLAGPVLRERVPLYRWIAIAVGFIGVLVIMQPGSGVLEWAALLALGGALLESGGQLISRMLPSNRSSAIAFYQSLIALLGALALVALFAGGEAAHDLHPSLAFLTRAWVTPTPAELATMVAAGPITAIAMWLYVHGYKVAPASFAASFEYSGLIWAVLFGYLFFADVPSVATWTGAAIVIASGLFMLRRDRRAWLL